MGFVRSKRPCSLVAASALLVPVCAGVAPVAFGQFSPNNLVVSRSVYDNKAGNVTVGEILPPNCALTTGGCPTTGTGATYNGVYPYVFNNDLYDGNFGITSPIYLDELSLTGKLLNTLAVPTGTTKQAATAN